MSYKYAPGMGAISLQASERPQIWTGNYGDCQNRGGTISWDLPLEVAPSHVSSFDYNEVPHCYESGSARESWPPKTQRCCYPNEFIQQKKAVYEAALDAWQAGMAQRALQQRLASSKLDREHNLVNNPAFSSPGDACSPPEGGVVKKAYIPVPKTQEDLDARRILGTRLEIKGCRGKHRVFDIDNIEICCPPGVVVPGPPVVNGNGAAVTVIEEPKYLGFTAQQLLLIGGGGLVLYMLAKR